MLNLVYEFKLQPTAAQATLFENWLEQCRKVYNYALAERKDWFKSRSCQINACSLRCEYIIAADTKRPTYASQCKSLTAARSAIPELRALQVHVLQQTLKRLEQAFVSMWEQGHGFPRFKKPGTMRSFVFPQLNTCVIKSASVNLPKIGWVKFCQSRQIPDMASVKQARVVRRASGWYVMLSVQWDVDVPQPMRCNHCGYTTDRDVAAAQVVALRGLAAVGHTVKMLAVSEAGPPLAGRVNSLESP